MAGGLYFRVRPGPVLFDRWVFAAIRPVHHSGLLVALTRLGSPFVVVAAAGAGCLATLRRNRPRAVALLVGPVAAVRASDWVMKPVVGRTYADVVSFPSGTVTAVAAVAAVGLLATPDPWRSLVAALGGTVTVLECVAVVALRWHYPTDARRRARRGRRRRPGQRLRGAGGDGARPARPWSGPGTGSRVPGGGGGPDAERPSRARTAPCR